MKKIIYLIIMVLPIVQYSCKKDSQNDFDRYDDYSQLAIDTLNYVLDVRDGGSFSSFYIMKTQSGKDSLWLCTGSRVSNYQNNYLGYDLLGFYIMTKLAVKNLEIHPDANATSYTPSIGDLLKLFPANKELDISQSDLPWTTFPNSMGTGIVFTWGTSEQYRTPVYEAIPNHNKSVCKIVRSEIYDSQRIKVELQFDIYLKHREMDKIIHIKNGKMITLIYIN